MKIVLTFVLFLLSSLGAFPCSIFRYTVDGRTYFCGNEDWTIRAAAIQSHKAANGGYAYAILGWSGLLPRWVQAGVNSEGLCFDWAAVPPQAYVRDPARQDLSLDFTVDVLKECATVDDVIRFIRRHNIPHLAEEHIMFADRTGKSCVVEFNHSKLQLVPNDSEAQIITNFHITDASLGWYPCQRYSRMEAFFRERGNKESRLVELLDSVHQEGQYETVYSYVCDLTAMEITVFAGHDYRAKKVYSLTDLFSKDSMVDIAP